jgi:hypothetical protein
MGMLKKKCNPGQNQSVIGGKNKLKVISDWTLWIFILETAFTEVARMTTVWSLRSATVKGVAVNGSFATHTMAIGGTRNLVMFVIG